MQLVVRARKAVYGALQRGDLLLRLRSRRLRVSQLLLCTLQAPETFPDNLITLHQARAKAQQTRPLAAPPCCDTWL